MGDAEKEHAGRLLSCQSVRRLLFASYYGFSVDEADASPLPATHARTIPVESINAPESIHQGADRPVQQNTDRSSLLHYTTRTPRRLQGTAGNRNIETLKHRNTVMPNTPIPENPNCRTAAAVTASTAPSQASAVSASPHPTHRTGGRRPHRAIFCFSRSAR